MVSSLSCPAQVDTRHSEGFFCSRVVLMTRHPANPFSLNGSLSCRVCGSCRVTREISRVGSCLEPRHVYLNGLCLGLC
jgi:hypothetical protein